MVKTVLVTGANGFVGSHVLDALRARRDVRVIAACRHKANLAPGFDGEVRVGDLRDPGYRSGVVQGVDVLCHAAAWSSLWGHAELSRRHYRDPTLALIDAALSSGVARFVNTSSTSAAAPDRSDDAMSHGIPRPFWPHLCSVVEIEDALRLRAAPRFQVVNLRLGIFVGQRYGLGLLPILVPRLKTHLVPWVAGGKTGLPLVDGRDIGHAFALAATAGGLEDYEAFNIVGPEVPRVRDVLALLHDEFGLPLPSFGVPFAGAYAFAWLMEALDRLVPWEPLVTRSIIHLLEDVHADNQRAEQRLGYRPVHSWRDAIRLQMQEMSLRQVRSMSMARPVI